MSRKYEPIFQINILPVEIVEEREEVEGQFDPSFPLAFVESVRVHDARRVVEAGAAHHRAVHVPEKPKKTFFNSS